MAPIFELIKNNAVPVNVMRSAAKGALPLSAEETLQILVYLTKNPVFGQDARMTLAKWDAQSAMDVLSSQAAAPEVLSYYWQEENRRPGLMRVLIENPTIPENSLIELAAHAPREIVAMLLASPRARGSAGVAEALLANPHLEARERQALESGKDDAAPPPEVESVGADDPEVEAAHRAFQQEHAGEIAAEEGKPFELTAEEPEPEAPDQPASPEENLQAAPAAPAPLDTAVDDQKRLTILQKISRLNVGERIKLGFIGGKEERAVLIRDTAKLVQNAVLQSPKLSDPEVESFAGSKNLQENVFREIARQRRFVKLYPVVRNLVNNPRCPLDVSLTLIKSLMIYDLKSLRHNKNVPDTIRKVASKLYLEKASRGGAKKE